MQSLLPFGFRKTLDEKCLDATTAIEVSIRMKEHKRQSLEKDLALLKGQPPSRDIAIKVLKIRKEIANIDIAIEKDRNKIGLFEQAQQPQSDVNDTRLLGLLRKRNARASNPMTVASLIEDSIADEEIVLDSREMLDGHLVDPRREITPEDEDELDDYMNLHTMHPVLPAIPSDRPTATPVHFEHRSSATPTTTMVMATRDLSVTPTIELSLEERCARLGLL